VRSHDESVPLAGRHAAVEVAADRAHADAVPHASAAPSLSESSEEQLALVASSRKFASASASASGAALAPGAEPKAIGSPRLAGSSAARTRAAPSVVSPSTRASAPAGMIEQPPF
jgi:hypothetical protein